jgi:hypothetical protein
VPQAPPPNPSPPVDHTSSHQPGDLDSSLQLLRSIRISAADTGAGGGDALPGSRRLAAPLKGLFTADLGDRCGGRAQPPGLCETSANGGPLYDDGDQVPLELRGAGGPADVVGVETDENAASVPCPPRGCLAPLAVRGVSQPLAAS